MNGPVDLVLVDANLVALTGPSDRSRGSALALAGGHIVAVGSVDDVRSGVARTAPTVDLAGATLLPGFNDSHNHMLDTGVQMGRVDLAACDGIDEVLAEIGRACRSGRPGSWVVASASWHESRLSERRLPFAAELDAVSDGRPVYIPRGGHVAAANTAALRAAGLAPDAADPPSGHYGRHADGALDGSVFEDSALAPLIAALPAEDDAHLDESLRLAMRRYNAVGITSVRDPWVTPVQLRAYQRAHLRGEMTVRANLLLAVEPGEGHRIASELDSWPTAPRLGDEMLRIGGLKLILDGGIEGAALAQPYADRADYAGHLYWEDADLDAVLRRAASLGWPVALHVVGDEALSQALRIVRGVASTHDIGELRWSLEHVFLADAQQIDAIARLPLLVGVQVPLLHALGANVQRCWGPERAARAMPVRALIDAGIQIACGTDSYVASHDPLRALDAAVTRRTADGHVLGASQAMTPYEALHAATAAGAYVTFEEHRKGVLAPGQLADLVVLGADPLDAEPGTCAAIPVLATCLGGQLVAAADKALAADWPDASRAIVDVPSL